MPNLRQSANIAKSHAWPESIPRRIRNFFGAAFIATLVFQACNYQDPNTVNEIRASRDFDNLGELALRDFSDNPLKVVVNIPQPDGSTVYFSSIPAVDMGGAKINFTGGEAPTTTTSPSGGSLSETTTTQPPILTQGGSEISVTFYPEAFKAYPGSMSALTIQPCEGDPSKSCQTSQVVDPSRADNLIAACIYGPNVFTAPDTSQLTRTGASTRMETALTRIVSTVSDRPIDLSLSLPKQTPTDTPIPLEGMTCNLTN